MDLKSRANEKIKELSARLKQAKKEAEYEKLQAHALDTMINLAEEKTIDPSHHYHKNHIFN